MTTQSNTDPIDNEVVATATDASTSTDIETSDQETIEAPIRSAESTPEPEEVVEAKKKEPKGEKTQPIYADPVAELKVLDPIISAITSKQTVDINTLGNRLGEIRKQLPEDAEQAKNRGTELHLHMVELLAQNKAYQDSMSGKALTAIEALKESLEAGNSDASLVAWDKVQTALAPLSGKLRNTVQKQLNEHRIRYQELKDWKLFASAEKKKELINAMQLLVESDIQGAERAKAISTAHQEWKTLGRSQQNESLWKKFKKLSDEAYAPCKEHFKQRKGALAENYQSRVALCDSLDADLARLGESPQESSESKQKISSEITSIISTAEARWKETAPVEQSKIKELQKRYYGLLNSLRKIRREAGQENAQLKQKIIAEAEALAELDDHREAMQSAKALQKQWKEIGPSNHKDDQAYWKAFRAACDKIFSTGEGVASGKNRPAKRGAPASNQDVSKLVAEIEAIFKNLESLLSLDEESFRQAREKYQDLSQAFSVALDPRLGNQRKNLSDQFNTLKRRLDTRYKALPDKKQQQRITTVSALTQVLDAYEDALLKANSSEEFAAAKAAFNLDAWKEMERPDDRTLLDILEGRLSALNNAKDAKSLNKLSKDAELEARRLCTELEINANTETPSGDQALRMQLQLEQLKNAFGQAKQSMSDIIKHARDEQLRLHCLGPLPKELREQLQMRFEAAAAKLGRS